MKNFVTGNTVCGLLGIQYPILQGGMLWLATAELAAEVSNRGGLGVISPYAGMEETADPLQNLHGQIRRVQELTRRPFGVNIPLDLPSSGLLLDILLREEVPVAITAAGSPALYTEMLRSAGIRVAHVVSSAAQAQSAQSCGVDAVIAEGNEAAGRIGREAVPLTSLLPYVRKTISIPVIAAGGIADGSGLTAAFALGADGVQLGTRFVAVEECIAHPEYKKAIVRSDEIDAIVTRRGIIPTRSLRNRFVTDVAALEASGASSSSVAQFVGRGRARKAQLEGDLQNGDAYAGTSVGRIKNVLPVAAVMEDLIDAYNNLLQ